MYKLIKTYTKVESTHIYIIVIPLGCELLWGDVAPDNVLYVAMCVSVYFYLFLSFVISRILTQFGCVDQGYILANVQDKKDYMAWAIIINTSAYILYITFPLKTHPRVSMCTVHNTGKTKTNKQTKKHAKDVNTARFTCVQRHSYSIAYEIVVSTVCLLVYRRGKTCKTRFLYG